MKVLSASLLLLANSCDGFQTLSQSSVAVRTSASKLNVVGPEHLQDLALQHSLFLDSHAFTHLAEAASAALDEGNNLGGAFQNVENALEVEEQIAQNQGYWAAYLNIFKSALLLVHNTVDAPLRSIGVDQTWGISIAIFTASVRSLLVPLSFQQSKSTEYIKALKPYVNEIKEKFKDNKEQQNRAIGKLYEDAEQNPLSGCLVSLIQLPVFLGLYRGIRNLAQDGKIDEPFLWIPSLQGPVSPPDFRGLDWLTTGWIDGVPQLGWETTIAFLIMPVILVLGQSLTMSILSPPVDEDAPEEERQQMEQSQTVLKFLPLLIGFFSLQVPAGLTIYWFTSNGFTLLQSLTVKAYYKANPPEIDLPDYWDALDDLASMTAEDKKKAAQAGIAVGPKMEDMIMEARFHPLVERSESLRATSNVQGKAGEIPAALAEWVGSISSPASVDEQKSPETAKA